MSRTRRSAKQAGATFERAIADHLRNTLNTPTIDRKTRTGIRDTGDIANVTDSHDRLIAIECKNYGGKLNPPQWLREAEGERKNYNAEVGIVIAKRRGTTNPEEQYVLMDVKTLTKLLTPPTEKGHKQC